ncbi:hypothetical protein HMPREF0602_2122, partial [Neisseria meningitidis ATCC 13091]
MCGFRTGTGGQECPPFFVRTRLNTRLIPTVCKGYFRSGGNYSG